MECLSHFHSSSSRWLRRRVRCQFYFVVAAQYFQRALRVSQKVTTHLYSELIHSIGVEAPKRKYRLTASTHREHSHFLALESAGKTLKSGRQTTFQEASALLHLLLLKSFSRLMKKSPERQRLRVNHPTSVERRLPLSYFWHPPHALWLSRSLGRISPATNLHELVWPGFFLSRAEEAHCALWLGRGEKFDSIWTGRRRCFTKLFWGLFLFDERTTCSFMSRPRRCEHDYFRPRLVTPTGWMKYFLRHQDNIRLIFIYYSKIYCKPLFLI